MSNRTSKKYKDLLIISTILIAFLKLKNLVVVKLLTHFFTKTDYAVYSFIFNTGLVFTTIAAGGVFLSLSRYISELNEEKDEKKIQTLMSTSTILVLVITTVFIGIYFLLNHIFKFVNFENMFLIFAFSTIFSLIYGFYSIFTLNTRIFKKIKIFLILHVVYEIVGFIFLLISLFISYNLNIVIISILAGRSTSFLIILFYWKKQVLPTTFDFSYAKKSLLFGLPKQFSDYSDSIIYYIISILVLNRISESTYADLSIAFSISTLITFIFSNFITNFLPHVTALNSETSEISKARMESDIKKTIESFILISIGGILILSSLGKYIIVIISNETYLNAYLMIPFLVGFQALFFLTKFLAIGLFLQEKTLLESLLSFISLAIGIGAALLLSSLYGLIGYCISFLIFAIVRLILIYLVSNRYKKISLDLKYLLKIGIICIFLLGSYFLLRLFNIHDYYPIAGILGYIILVLVLKLINLRELLETLKIYLQQFLSSISKMKNK